MNKLLCIVGPTATGKTKLALYLANIFPSLLVSADSRQVYRGMDIVTGKDHPSEVMFVGVDIVDPSQPCSVSVWYDRVITHIRQAWREKKLVIVVGGTGLYVQALIKGIATLSIPLNPLLRQSLESLSLTELQTKLHTLAPTKYLQMNHSDIHNPRRLIRAIEVALTPVPHTIPPQATSHTLIIGLQCIDDSNHRYRVSQRVEERISLGAIAETKSLLSSSSSQALTALGYRSLVAYLQGKLSRQLMVEAWVRDELAYVKRQLTYFRKIPDISWYDVTNLDFARVASTVKAWYDKFN